VTGRGRRGAAALCALAALTAALACAAPGRADTSPPISITIADGLTASDGASTLPPVAFGTGESVSTTDAALLRLAITLAHTEGIVVADDPAFLLEILLQNGEPVSTADIVKLLLGIQLAQGETVSGQDAVSLLLGIRQSTSESISVADATALLLGVKQTTTEQIGVGDAVSVTPVIAPTATTVVSSGSPALAGTTVTYTASVSTTGGQPVPAGTVTFSVDGTAIGSSAVNANGVSQLTTTASVLGSHTVQAAYGGAPGYALSSGTASQGVWDFALSLTPATVTVQRGGTATFTVTSTLLPGSVTTGLPLLTIAASQGTVAQQLAVPGTVQLLVPTGAGTPPGRGSVTVTPVGVDQHQTSAYIYVNDPPVPSAGGPYAAAEGTAVALHGSATDADGDTLTYAWNVGGVTATGADATVTAPDGPATVPVTLTVCDDHGACASAATTLTVTNVPPTVTLTATPSPVNEGGTFTLSAKIADSAADVAAGFAIAFDCGTGTFVPSSTPSTSCPAVDDPGVTARAQVTDKDGGSTVATLVVPIRNVAPTVKITTPAPGAVVFVGAHVPLAASFTDPGVRDTHTASFAVAGSTVAATVTESAGSGTTASAWTPSAAGIDTLTANVRDNAGAVGSAAQALIVVDPFGSTTGLGRIGPRHAHVGFAFDAHYLRGSATPTGTVLVGSHGVDFRATSLGWLVVAGRTATLQGTGVANGVGGYSFQLQAVDGRPGLFAIKIWKTSTGAVLLDTGAPQPLTAGDLAVRG
jgi:Bacterial Ig-like domain (group 3)/PKD domain